MVTKNNINPFTIMHKFASSTGITDTAHPPRRYLWTDAFAVCNFIELYRQSENRDYLLLAIKLVDQVHHILGRNRENNAWLSGLNDEKASLHPTRGGLRIGKKLNERREDEPYDDHLEWERDGQYFHYLTKWMHALNCLSRATGKGIYNQWAIELGQVAHAAFTYASPVGNAKRMYWKMSTDLSRPLLYSMGQHDPLDGLITYRQLQATTVLFPDTPDNLSLKKEISDFSAMCEGVDWATRDPLGIGGLLIDAYRLLQLTARYHLPATPMLESLLQDIERSLQAFISPEQHNSFNLRADYRLAFRELGLATGLSALDNMQTVLNSHPEKFTNREQINHSLINLSRYYRFYEMIKDFWLKTESRSNSTWQEHNDINYVMLATCLAPDSFLNI